MAQEKRMGNTGFLQDALLNDKDFLRVMARASLKSISTRSTWQRSQTMLPSLNNVLHCRQAFIDWMAFLVH